MAEGVLHFLPWIHVGKDLFDLRTFEGHLMMDGAIGNSLGWELDFWDIYQDSRIG
jgi:hypothetical protein